GRGNSQCASLLIRELRFRLIENELITLAARTFPCVVHTIRLSIRIVSHHCVIEGRFCRIAPRVARTIVLDRLPHFIRRQKETRTDKTWLSFLPFIRASIGRRAHASTSASAVALNTPLHVKLILTLVRWTE